MPFRPGPTALLLATALLFCSGPAHGEVYSSGINWAEPPVVTPGASVGDPPSDALVLFDGTDLSQWKGGEGWTVEDGEMVVGKSFLSTKEAFGDMQLHLEWKAQTPPTGDGQKRGNSGIYLMGKYELQILDSYQNPTYFDGQAGALYKQSPPAVNAMRPPGKWNTYDVFWTAPRFRADGEVETPAYITLMHNSVLVLNHVEVQGETRHDRPPAYKAHPSRASFGLQNKLGQVRFRNIWVRHYEPAAINEPGLSADG